MKHYLVDTNVVIDMLLNREDADAACAVKHALSHLFCYDRLDVQTLIKYVLEIRDI